MRVWVLAVLIAVIGGISPVRAFTPPPFMDHAAFLELEPADKRAYMRLIMMAMVDLEEGHRQTQKLPDTPANQQLKTTMQQRLQTFKSAVSILLDQVSVASAHARGRARTAARPAVPNAQYCHNISANSAPAVTDSGRCVIGGWESTFVKPAGQARGYCQRPACSTDASVRQRFVQAQTPCGSPTKMACNPALYGYKNGTQPFCINVDQIDTQNASLACLIEFESPADSVDARLDALVARLESGNAAAINAFNDVAERILNTCACSSEQTAQLEPRLRLTPEYVSYMQGHRTCYSLLGMMRWYSTKLGSRSAGACSTVFNNENVVTFMGQLSTLQNYTRRVGVLGNAQTPVALTSENYSGILQGYRARFVTDASHMPTDAGTNKRVVANNAVALDRVQELETIIGNARSQANWCPFRKPARLPEPTDPPPVPPTSVLTTNSDGGDEVGPDIIVTARRDPTPDPTPTPTPTPTPPPPQAPPEPTCTYRLSVLREGTSQTVTLTANLTIIAARTTATPTSTGQTPTAPQTPPQTDTSTRTNTWSCLVAGARQTLPSSTSNSLSTSIQVPATTALSSLGVEVKSGEVVCTREAETPAEPPRAPAAEDVRDGGECMLDTQDTQNGKFRLSLIDNPSFEVRSIEWSSNVTSAPAGRDGRQAQADAATADATDEAEDAVTEHELTKQATPTRYTARVVHKNKSTNRLYEQNCDITYPAAAAPRPMMQPQQQQQMPQLPQVDFLRGGQF